MQPDEPLTFRMPYLCIKFLQFTTLSSTKKHLASPKYVTIKIADPSKHLAPLQS